MRASVVLCLLFSILSQVIGSWNVRKDLLCVECLGRKTLTQSVIVLGEHINSLGYAPGLHAWTAPTLNGAARTRRPRR